MKQLKLAAITLSTIISAGCATGPASNAPHINVSAFPHGKALTPSEIDAAVRGNQMNGDITRANGSKILNIVYIFEASGSLRGVWANGGGDVGKWYVNANDELCTDWIRETSACGRPSVFHGKLLLQNPRTGGQFLQR